MSSARVVLAVMCLAAFGVAVWLVSDSMRTTAAVNPIAVDGGITTPRPVTAVDRPGGGDSSLRPVVRPVPFAAAQDPEAASVAESAPAANPNDLAIVVTVVTFDGMPAAHAAVTFRTRRRGAGVMETRRTSDVGVVVFGPWTQRSGPDLDDVVTIESVSAPAPTSRVEGVLRDLHATGVILRLPPTGTVVVNVQSSEPGPRSASVGLRRLGEFVPKDAGGETQRANDGGVAVFPFVPLNAVFAVTVDLEGFDTPPRKAVGPTAAGESVTIDVPVGPRLHVVRARILSGDGKPLSSAFIRIEGGASDNATKWAELGDGTTGENGELDCLLRAEPMSGAAELRFSRIERGDAVAAANVRLPDPLPPSTIDAGDVRLREAPVGAEGIVVTEDGRPAQDVALELFMRKPSAKKPVDWVPSGRVMGRSGADGRFQLRGVLAGIDASIELALGVRDAVLVNPEPVAFRLGARDLRLVVAVGAGIAGRIVLPATWSGEELAVTLEAGGEGGRSLPIRIDTDGNFDDRTVPRMQGSFVIRHPRKGGDVVRRFDGVTISADATDPRLREIHLSETCLLVAVRARAPDGSPVNRFHVAELDGSAPKGSAPRYPAARPVGEVHLAFPDRAPRSLLVEAEGFRSIRLDGVVSDCDVALQAGLPVACEAAGIPELGSDAVVTAEFTSESSASPIDARVARDGSFSCDLPSAGPWRIHLAASAGKPGFSTELAGPFQIHVKDVTEAQRFHVTLSVADRAILQRSVAAVRAKLAK